MEVFNCFEKYKKLIPVLITSKEVMFVILYYQFFDKLELMVYFRIKFAEKVLYLLHGKPTVHYHFKVDNYIQNNLKMVLFISTCRHICYRDTRLFDFTTYEGCSNMNASSFITVFTYMLQENGKRFYEGLYVTFELASDIKKNTVYLSSNIPLNEGHVSILTNSMLRTYTSDIDERIILR